MSKSIAFNASAMEQVRAGQEREMKSLIGVMESTKREYEQKAVQLEQEAAALEAKAAVQDSFARSAMMSETYTDIGGNMRTRSVPDMAKRARAAQEAGTLREQAKLKKAQAAALRAQAAALNTETGKLNSTITQTNAYIRNLIEIVQRTDLSYAQQMDAINAATYAYNVRMKALCDSFNDSFPLYSSSVSTLVQGVTKTLFGSGTMSQLAGEVKSCAYGVDPVNMSTGNFIYSKEDIEIPGRFPIVFKRFYNSIDDTNATLGKNWTHNFHIRLRNHEGYAQIAHADGHTEIYHKLEEDVYLPPMEHGNVLQKTQDGYALIFPTMEQYYFDNDGHLRSIADLNQNRTQLEYMDGLLCKVHNSCGNLTLEYDKNNHLVKVCDHTGRQVLLEYSGDMLCKVTHPSGAVLGYKYSAQEKLVDIVNPLGITAIRNEYDENYRAVKQSFADGGFSTISYDDSRAVSVCTEQNGNKIQYFRDEKYRTVKTVYEDSEERFEYDDSNNRTMHVDRNGNLRRYEYDIRGNVTKYTDSLNCVVLTEYNELNKPVKITGPDGGVTDFEYDPNGNMVRSVDPLQREIRFRHDSHGFVIGLTIPDGSTNTVEYDDRGNIVAVTDTDASKTQYEYDSLNRVVKTINGEGYPTLFEYTGKGDISKVTDASGNTRLYEYNLAGKITRITDFDGGVIEYKYNKLGKVEEIINQQGGGTKFTYDLMWNVTGVTNPNGDTIRYVYDKLQRIVQSIDEEGNVTKYEHDPNGNVTAAVSPDGARTIIRYDALDRQKCIIEPDGAVTKLAYDVAGNLSTVTDALGNVTKREYDLAGQLTCLTDALGNKTRFAYTLLGQIESITDAKGGKQLYSYYPGGRIKSVTRPCGESEAYAYDKNGNIITVTDALGNNTSLVYDCLDRVCEIVNPLGHSKKFRYDALGNIISITDENAHETQYKYSALGDIVEVIDANGHSTKYGYDGAGRLTKVEQYRLIDDTLAGVKCPEYQVTTYERNKKGEVIAVKSPLGKLVKLGYDKVGNITSKMDEEGLETLYKYNLVGNLTGVSYADGKTVELSYNALKQLTEMRDWLGTTKIELDELGRATKVTDFEGKEIGYTWDSLGQKEKLVYPDNSEVNYEYTASGKIKQVLSETGTTNYSYDAMGRIMERILPDSTITKYKLNPLGRLTSLTHSRNNEILDQFKYTYDPVGNITQIDKHRAGMEADSGVFEYRYDPLGRLVEAVHGDATKRYRYDELGNRVGSWQNGLETTHSYNARNQLIKTQEGDAVKEYRYDGRGNLTDITENGQVKNKYTFDATNMMVGAFTADKGKAEYAYNGFKNRVKKLESLQSTDTAMPDPCKEIRYVLDMTLPYDNLLMTQGAQNQSFVWGNSLLSANGEEKFYYLQDHLGSPIRLLGTEQNDTVLAYDEFGVPVVGVQQNQNNPFGFTGYQMDDVSGMYFAQNRYYAAGLGRFGAEDPIKSGLNWYGYCQSNPLAFIDPTGCILKVSGSDAYENQVEDQLNSLTSDTVTIVNGDIKITNRVDNPSLEHGTDLVRRLVDNTQYTSTIKSSDMQGNATTIFNSSSSGQTRSGSAFGSNIFGEMGSGNSSTIIFNAFMDKIDLLTLNPTTGFTSNQQTSLNIVLAHELIHAERGMRGAVLQGTGKTSYSTGLHPIWGFLGVSNKVKETNYNEELAVIGLLHSLDKDITENMMRAEQLAALLSAKGDDVCESEAAGLNPRSGVGRQS